MPLKPSGHTPTSSPLDSSRSASALQARVWPALRAMRSEEGRGEREVGAEHPQVPVRRVVVADGHRGHHGIERNRPRSDWRRRARARCRGCCRARASRPGTSAGTAGRQTGARMWSVRSASKPKSSTSYSPVIRRRRNASAPASCRSHSAGSRAPSAAGRAPACSREAAPGFRAVPRAPARAVPRGRPAGSPPRPCRRWSVPRRPSPSRRAAWRPAVASPDAPSARASLLSGMTRASGTDGSLPSPLSSITASPLLSGGRSLTPAGAGAPAGRAPTARLWPSVRAR